MKEKIEYMRKGIKAALEKYEPDTFMFTTRVMEELVDDLEMMQDKVDSNEIIMKEQIQIMKLLENKIQELEEQNKNLVRRHKRIYRLTKSVILHSFAI